MVVGAADFWAGGAGVMVVNGFGHVLGVEVQVVVNFGYEKKSRNFFELIGFFMDVKNEMLQVLVSVLCCKEIF